MRFNLDDKVATTAYRQKVNPPNAQRHFTAHIKPASLQCLGNVYL